MRKMQSKPNLAVIDEAIRRIERGIDRYTCCALSYACEKFGGGYYSSADDSKSGSIYRTQYSLVMTNKRGKLPSWWDSVMPHKKERIAALKKFRAACVAAGKAV